MPSPALTLWIDIATGKLLSGWQSISYAPNPSLKQGDSVGIELHIIKNFLGGSFSEYEFSPSTAVTLAIGRVDEAPSGGTFKLTYGGDTTAAIAAGATAATVQTALNAIESITEEGGVTVTKVGNAYRIIWNTPATTFNTLSYTFNELYPTSTISTGVVRVGSPTQKQVYQVHIKQSPVANVTSFVNQDAPTISATQIHAPAFTGDTKVWRISINPQPKSGSFLIGFDVGTTNYTTNAIDVNASGDSLLSILNATYAGAWSVVKSGVNQWDIATTNATIFNLNVADSGIVAFSSKYGVLDLDTAEVEDLLAGDASADAIMEVQLDTDGVKFTILSQPVTILNDLIDDAVYSIVQWGDYIPADKVVRFDTAQTLTNAEKQQARDNIGAVNVDTSSLVAKDIELEGRIGDLEGLGLTEDQYDAIDQSNAPTGTNVFITESALATELLDKADSEHTHTISDVNNLLTALNNKSDVGHTHTFSDIGGLTDALSDFVTQTQLNQKADINHTHTSFNEVSIGYIEDVQAITFDEGFVLTSGIFASYLGEAPINGTGYVRQDGLWSNQPSFQSASINGGNLVIGALSTIKNELNAPITFELYNDTGAGTTFLHTFNPYNGQFEFSSGGGGIKFSDTTIQTTAALPLTGGTLSGKVSCTTSSSSAGINIGTVTTTPTTISNGDVWIGSQLNFRNNAGQDRTVAVTNSSNSIQVTANSSTVMVIAQNSTTSTFGALAVNNASTAFAATVSQTNTTATNGALSVSNASAGTAVRITQTGTGNALVVEDEASDPSPFTINNNGKVGVGIAPDATAAITVDSNGIKFGTGAVVQAVSAIVTATGTYDKEIPVTINGVNYRIPCRQV